MISVSMNALYDEITIPDLGICVTKRKILDVDERIGEAISQNMAKQLAGGLSKATGVNYRLPTNYELLMALRWSLERDKSLALSFVNGPREWVDDIIVDGRYVSVGNRVIKVVFPDNGLIFNPNMITPDTGYPTETLSYSEVSTDPDYKKLAYFSLKRSGKISVLRGDPKNPSVFARLYSICADFGPDEPVEYTSFRLCREV